MAIDHIVLCGGLPPPTPVKGQKTTALFLYGPRKNVNLKLDDISKKTAANLPHILIDLLEIAAYVYSADQATKRGGNGVSDVGGRWRRNLHFFIPVRNPAAWSQKELYESLTTTLNILTEDTFRFTFSLITNPTPIDQYIEGAVERSGIDQVLLFSGGLDSLGGAVQECVIDKHSVAIVSHRSTPKIDTPQQNLVAHLISHCSRDIVLHVPVWVNKEKALGVEATQRMRSFLYSSLAAAVAAMFRLSSFKFYENGITSMNLPISEQLVGARASRTTHPQVLNGMARIFGLLLQQDFAVDNPFLWKTKSQVIDLIGGAGCGDLVKHTVSCIFTRERTNEHSHCGVCFQCVGRRFAALASGFAGADPADKYAVDLLTGPRDHNPDVMLLESLIRTARDMEVMSDRQFFARFGETSRVINHLPGKVDAVGTSIHELHRRYGAEIGRVLAGGLSGHAAEIHEGRLPETCAIALGLHDKYKKQLEASPAGTVFTSDGGNGKKRLSQRDQSLFAVIGENLLSTLTNAEILKRIALMRDFDKTFVPDKAEGIRARLNRIRNHYELPSSSSLKKKPVNPTSGQRSKGI